MAIETPSDRDFACFFCSDGKSRDRKADCPNCGKPIDVGPLLQGAQLGSYKLSEYIDRGYYGATFKAANRIGAVSAIKVVPRKLYEKHGKSFTEEIEKYAVLGTHPNIADLRDAGEDSVTLFGVSVPVYFVVMEWIDGISLTNFLSSQKLTANIVYGAILDIASGLSRFEAKNLWHNDLNSDNVRVKSLTPEEVQTRRSESPFILKILDTGSAVFREAFKQRSLNDFAFLGQHMSALVVAAQRSSSSMPLEDQFFLNQLSSVVSALLEEDPSRRIQTSQELIDTVSRLYRERYLLSQTVEARLNNPFEYLNANDFPSETLVSRLFSDRFPWVGGVILTSAQSILITGPRGSGKTMILRSMRLKTRLNPKVDGEAPEDILARIETDPSIAFFISARLEIGNYAPLTKLPAWMEVGESILYYFYLLYLYEVCDTLHFANINSVLRIKSDAEHSFCRFLSELFGETIISFSSALASVKARQLEIRTNPNIQVPPAMQSARFLTDLCEQFRQVHPSLSTKPIVFLLDDFSLPKVPSTVQKSLLPVIWNSGGGYSFRVTAHSESMETVDARQNTYVVNRDYIEINLGAAYIDTIDAKRRQIDSCISDIFSRRFALSGETRASVKTLLGDSPKIGIAHEIVRRTKEKALRGLRYYGWDVVLSLGSGDISYTIDLLGKMLDGQGSIASVPISSHHQNRVIRQYARRELYRLQDYSVSTCNLYDIALNFGKMSKFKLTNEVIKDGKTTRPPEYLRIEVQLNQFPDELKSVVAELLRNGVFVDGGFSNSSQGTPARRLIFRRMFTPAFPTTFNSRDTFPMTPQNFLEFAKNPPGMLRRMLGESGIAPAEQQLTMDALFQPSVEPD